MSNFNTLDTPFDISGVCGFQPGQYHLTDGELHPVCSSNVPVDQWRWAKMYDPTDPEHDHDKIRGLLSCSECKQILTSVLDSGGDTDG